jgi:hypothetical protein
MKYQTYLLAIFISLPSNSSLKNVSCSNNKTEEMFEAFESREEPKKSP